jgi:anhydro-N-acetylmuramic acid kinase
MTALCVGGVHNAYGLERLQSHLAGIAAESTALHGIPPDWIEAMAIAWMVQRYVENKPGNLPSVRGASDSVVSGALSNPGS